MFSEAFSGSSQNEGNIHWNAHVLSLLITCVIVGHLSLTHPFPQIIAPSHVGPPPSGMIDAVKEGDTGDVEASVPHENPT